MNNDYDQIEEELKRKNSDKKAEHKISGRSVFRLRKIIQEKGENIEEGDNGQSMDGPKK